MNVNKIPWLKFGNIATLSQWHAIPTGQKLEIIYYQVKSPRLSVSGIGFNLLKSDMIFWKTTGLALNGKSEVYHIPTFLEVWRAYSRQCYIKHSMCKALIGHIYSYSFKGLALAFVDCFCKAQGNRKLHTSELNVGVTLRLPHNVS